MWKKLFRDGELPEIKTTVGLDAGDINRAALTFFLVAVLIIAAFFALKKVLA